MQLMSMVYNLLFAVSLFVPTSTLSHTDVDDTLSQACFYVGPTSSDTLVVSANDKTCKMRMTFHGRDDDIRNSTHRNGAENNTVRRNGTRAIRSPVYFSHQQRPRVGKLSYAGLRGTLRHSSARHTQASHTFRTCISLKTYYISIRGRHVGSLGKNSTNSK